VNFEHLIQINDPLNPLLAPLSRQQLWKGLMTRVENPVPFLPGLESCEIVERSDAGLTRVLRFGQATIRDRVTCRSEEWVCFEVVPGPGHAGGSLTITIEEPSPSVLFLRFAYRTSLPEATNGEELRYAEYVKSAYHESDLDTVRLIREMSVAGGGH
jgi:glyoxylase-like metal-dependent hydrolase (beta-lactamase superfamily II)